MRITKVILRHAARLAAPMALAVIAGCAAPVDGSGISDPYSEQNRAVHEFNKALDTALLRPVSNAYGETVPAELRQTFSNVTGNLELPVDFINHVLQGDIADAGETLTRFMLNSTFGLAGLRDPAADAGVFARPTSFGETLAKWGVAEGNYLELPLLGPSSERDLTGRVVDFAMNPMREVISDADLSTEVLVLQGLDLVNTRYEYRGIIDTLLYESADSYTASRISYLQNKLHRINEGLVSEDLEDPYADY